MSTIFFSYAHKNGTTALRVVNALRAQGFVVWMDQSNIPGSENWVQAIHTNLGEAGAIAVLWSTEAEASEWVLKEIEVGANRAFSQNVPIFVLMLDETPVPKRLQDMQYIPCTADLDQGIHQLIRDLSRKKPDLRWPRLGFDGKLPLGQQAHKREVSGAPLVGTPILRSETCQAEVVGPPELTVGKVAQLKLCLQFFQGRSDEVLLNKVYRQFPDEAHQFLALVVTGRYDDHTQQFRLENENPAEWLEAVNTTYTAVQAVAEQGVTTLQVFSLAPNALTFALGMQFKRFWRVQLYNYVPPEERYALVLDSREFTTV